MRPFVFDIDPANVDADGIANDLPTGTAWAFGTDAEWLASGSGDNLAHQLVITTAGNEPAGNAPTLTLVGTDPDGIAQTEDIVLPNATTIETTKYWLSVTSGTTDAATVGTFDIGWVDEVMTKTLPLNYRAHEAATHAVDVTGTIDYTIQETLEEIHPQLKAGTPENLSWFSMEAMTAKTADLKELGELHSSAARLVVNSYTATAELKWVIFQNEN
jgi:hypothetical protein